MFWTGKGTTRELLTILIALLLLQPWIASLGSGNDGLESVEPHTAELVSRWSFVVSKKTGDQQPTTNDQRRSCFLYALGAEKDKNPYDKFRNADYSNKGLVSEEDELRLGPQLHEEVSKEYKLVTDRSISSYLQRLGERLARKSKRPNIEYHFFVIEDPTVNAFALPGGYIYVHTGLLNTVESESELASVIAHETGHVVARHGLKNLKRAQRTQLLLGLGGIAIGAIGGRSTGAQVTETLSQLLAAGVFTKLSRDAEREADFLGLHDMYRTDYDPRGMISMFQRLEKISRGNPDLLGFVFRTHPPASERVRNTQAEITDHLSLSESLKDDSDEFRAMKRRFKELGLDKVPGRRQK